MPSRPPTPDSANGLDRFGMSSTPSVPEAPPRGFAPPGREAPRKPVPAWVPIRTLKARHRKLILDHLVQLDEHDRYLRFGFHAPLEQMVKYVASIDFKRDEVFGVFNRKLQLVAVAHLAAMPDGSSPAGPGVPCMEFGVSVLPAGRGRGLGKRLFEHAMMHARNHGARAMMIHALTENRPMLRIAVKAGALLETDGPEAEAWLRLPQDSLRTHLEQSFLAWAAEVSFRTMQRLFKVRQWLS